MTKSGGDVDDEVKTRESIAVTGIFCTFVGIIAENYEPSSSAKPTSAYDDHPGEPVGASAGRPISADYARNVVV